jgi:DNA-binding transcriptional MerR regulator
MMADSEAGAPDVPRPRPSSRHGKSASAFRTISEVAGELDVAQHVLRFWESKFPQVRPLKRGGGRRYYRPEDVDLLRQIRSLLYEEGYTIKGAQKLLRTQRRTGGPREDDEGTDGELPFAPAEAETAPAPSATLPEELRAGLEDLRHELSELRATLRSALG